MAKQEVVLTTCDNCGTEETMPLKKSGAPFTDPFILPEGWLHIAANNKDTLLLERQLCPSCAKPVLEAVGLGDGA